MPIVLGIQSACVKKTGPNAVEGEADAEAEVGFEVEVLARVLYRKYNFIFNTIFKVKQKCNVRMTSTLTR